MSSNNSGTALPMDTLAEYLASQLGGAVKDLAALEFPGGASNPTYKLTFNGETYVLRSKPRGILVSSAHAIDREYRVINALGTTDFPVPKTLLYCSDIDVIGAEFYIMQYIAGAVTEDFTIPNASKDDRAAIYDSMNETMAKLHSIDPDSIGLSDYGKPGNYFARQINTWVRQYQKQKQIIPRFEGLAEWLTTNIIDDEQRSIVHGDYRLANLIVAPDQPKVSAVLDWELSTIGHPLADFAYSLSQWYLPNVNKHFGKVTLADANLDELGIPSMEAYTQAYSERMGIEIPAKDLYYSIAFNLFRLAGIIIGTMARTEAGTAKNEFAQSSAHNLDPTIEQAWHYVNKAEHC